MRYPLDVKAVHHNEYGDENQLVIAELPGPAIVEGSIRIAVAASGLNRADLLQRRGLYPPPPGAPETLGLECAGVVTETMPGLDAFSLQKRVMALVAGGGQAEEVVVHAGSVLPTPDHFSDTEAGAFTEVYLTAYLNVFMLGGLRPGMTALIHGGSGGVGTAAIQLVKEAGARSMVTAGSDDRCSRCLDLGADRAVNYREEDFGDAVAELTGGRGVDVVLDCIGGSYLDRNLRCLAADGRLVIIGLMGGSRAEVNLGLLLSRRLQVVGSTLRALPDERKAGIVGSFLDRFGEALTDGRLRPVIDSVFPMDRVADAHRRLASGDAFGKVVLTIGD